MTYLTIGIDRPRQRPRQPIQRRRLQNDVQRQRIPIIDPVEVLLADPVAGTDVSANRSDESSQAPYDTAQSVMQSRIRIANQPVEYAAASPIPIPLWDKTEQYVPSKQ